MKRSFLLTLMISAFAMPIAMGQTKTISKTRVVDNKSSFDKFWERVGISYLGVLTTPVIEDIVDGKWNNAALSPGFGTNNRDTYPTNIWNQVNFSFNYGAKLSFNIIPRFTVNLASVPEANGDTSLVFIEDALVGFSGVVYSSADKKFNYWIRPGVRLPTSRGSRNSKNTTFGRLTHQPEYAHNPSYDFNKQWQVAMFQQFRFYIYEDRYNWSRLRIVTSPYVQYTIDDANYIQVYYNHFWQNDFKWKSINDRDPVFKDLWQEVQVGYGHNFANGLGIFPYVSMFVNDVPLATKSAFFGAWITYKIK